MTASGIYDPMSGEVPDKGVAAGIAISALTFVVLLHMFSRRGGILVNNAFAIAKVLLLVAIIALGIAKAAGAFPGSGKAPLENFTKGVFVTNRKDPTSWSNSLMFCMYTFSGFEQPFYVCCHLTECLYLLTSFTGSRRVKEPAQEFPKVHRPSDVHCDCFVHARQHCLCKSGAMRCLFLC